MPQGSKSIIAQLEQQKAAIQRALDALREVDEIGDATVTPTPKKPGGRPAKSTGGMTPAGRKRLAEVMKQRWAAKGTAAQAKKKPRRPRKAA
jgi:hypothetical protein